MTTKNFVSAALLCLAVSPLLAAPTLNVVPGGLEGNNFVWDVSITPDLALAGGSTPIGLELGFRLAGAPLLSATNINPAQFDTPNPGMVIFGWETLTDLDPGPGVNNRPVGLQSNLATDEIFAAYGSVSFTTPGPKQFLKIITQSPGNGGPSPSSTIEWLGKYAVGQGRIAQLISGPPFAQNFDIFSGTATQMVPEPANSVMLVFGAIAIALRVNRRRSARVTNG